MITSRSSDISLAVTFSSNHPCFSIFSFNCSSVTFSTIPCTVRFAITLSTDFWVCDLLGRVLKESQVAHLTVFPLCVMLTFETNTARGLCTCLNKNLSKLKSRAITKILPQKLSSQIYICLNVRCSYISCIRFSSSLWQVSKAGLGKSPCSVRNCYP